MSSRRTRKPRPAMQATTSNRGNWHLPGSLAEDLEAALKGEASQPVRRDLLERPPLDASNGIAGVHHHVGQEVAVAPAHTG